MRASNLGLAAMVLVTAGCAARPQRGPVVQVVRVVPPPTPAASPAASPAAPKASPSPVAERSRKVAEAREREAFVPLLADADTKVAVPSMRRFAEAPTLARAAAAMPRTLEGEMRAWMALQKEGTLDDGLMQEVFLVVSSANDCGY